MADKPPSTPVKVSASAANYTPATLDPQLRTDINATLIHGGQVTEIQEALLHALNANQANWPAAIQTHALNILRSGEATTFPALLRRVMEDIRQETALQAAAANSGTPAAEKPKDPDRPDLVVPQEVIDEALKITREKIENIIDVQYNNQPSVGTGGGGEDENNNNNDTISARGGGSVTPSGGKK